MNNAKYKVGIDLAPASMRATAPGTARLVEEQARALFRLDVPWTWVPVFSNAENPLRDETASMQPLTARNRKFSLYASFELGPLWKQAGCNLGFATAYFVPFTGPPVVANYFDANFFEHVDAWHRKKQLARYLWTRTLFSHSVKRSRSLFILSDYGKNRMVSLFPETANKWVVTSCGFTPPGPEPHQPPAWATTLKRPYFLYAGSFSDNKNQRNLIEAWRLLQLKYSDAPGLLLLGPGPDSYIRDVIEPLHRSLPRPEEILRPGLAADDALAWAYRNALGYIQPSFAEGFGMPVIEAMSCGLPVACSDTTSLPETAGGASLMFDPARPASICERVEQIWQDNSIRQKLAAAGRERAGQFSWEKNAKTVALVIMEHLSAIRR